MDISLNETQNIFTYLGQFLIAALFINSAIDKLRRRDVYVNYMESFKVRRQVLPTTILLDALGGLSIIFGFFVGPVSFILAIYVIIATCIFHFAPRNVDEMGQFYKNMALVGGLLMISASDINGINIVLSLL